MSIEQQLSLFEGRPVQFIEKDGQIWFTAEEIGSHLGYSDPKDDVNRLFNKNKEELEPYSTTTKLVAVDGRSREKRIYSEEGVYLLTMLARTDKAREFRSRVARLLRQIRQRRLELARQTGQQEAIEAFTSLTATQLRLFDKILYYSRMGLNGGEISKILEISSDTVNRALRKFKKAGMEVGK
jgi:prophage antirepressor-like protein